MNFLIIVMLLSSLVLAFTAWRGGRYGLRRLQITKYKKFDFLVLIGDGLRLEQSTQAQGGRAVMVMARGFILKRNVRKDLRLFTTYTARVYAIFYTCDFMGLGAGLTLLLSAPYNRHRTGMPIAR